MYRELLTEGTYDNATEYAQLLAFAKAEFEEEIAKEEYAKEEYEHGAERNENGEEKVCDHTSEELSLRAN